MNIIAEARTILEDAGYSTFVSRRPDRAFLFEDESVMGFLWEANSVDDIVRNWKTRQDDFLADNAPRIRASGQKAWNIYSVLLTEELPPDGSLGDILAIEENLNATRKIARAGVSSRGELQAALRPILPIRHEGLQTQSRDAIDSLRAQLSDIPAVALTALFDPVQTDLSSRFLEAYDNQAN